MHHPFEAKKAMSYLPMMVNIRSRSSKNVQSKISKGACSKQRSPVRSLFTLLTCAEASAKEDS
jgi:hypothetical protein